jgi:hypothetical protein
MHATTSGSSRVLYATLSCSGGFGFGPLPGRAPPRFLAASFFCFMLFCFPVVVHVIPVVWRVIVLLYRFPISRLAFLRSVGNAHATNESPAASHAALISSHSASGTRPSCLAGFGLYAPRSVAGRPLLALLISPVPGELAFAFATKPLPVLRCIRLATGASHHSCVQ